VGTAYVGSCKPVESRSNASEKAEIAALNKMPKTARDRASYGTLSVPNELNSRPCLRDHTVRQECSRSHVTVCNFSPNADQSEVKFQVNPEADEKCETVGENDSVVRTRSSKSKRMKRQQNRSRTRLVSEQLLRCSSCYKTFSQCGRLLEQDNDNESEKLNCPYCQHPCFKINEATVDSTPPEAVVKTDDIHGCSTVDASQLMTECTSASALNQKQQSQHNQDSATVRTAKSVDGNCSGKWHRCNVCSRRCFTDAALKQHQQVHAEGSSQSTVASCRTCGKKFRHPSYLRCHERLHEGGKRPYVCDVCGKGFIGSSNLTTHRRIHTGDRPYACSVCHKRFFQLCAVREHEKIHVGIKMFVCDVCGKQFMTHAQLYNHSRTHGGEKSFECEVCKKRFYTNGDLVKHARIHADSRPFVCDVCGKGFKYSSNLHGHSRIHTGSRPFPCQTCGKAFTYSSHLTRHAKMHTRNNVDLEESSTAVKEEGLSSPPAVTQSTDNIVGVTGTTTSAILLIRPELLLGGTQVATNILSGFPVGPFTARLCN